VQKSSLKKTVKKLKLQKYSDYQQKCLELAKEEEDLWLKPVETEPVDGNFAIKVPFHLSLKFFSFMNGYELLTKAAKLNKRYRKEVPDNALLDQQKVLTVNIYKHSKSVDLELRYLAKLIDKFNLNYPLRTTTKVRNYLLSYCKRDN
jgi:hypothetical protein